MGEAKRRGTFEERKAQGIERRRIEEARASEERARIKAERRAQAAERQKLLSPAERKEAVFIADGGHNTRLLLAAAAGALAGSGVIIVDDRKEQFDIGERQ